VGVAATICAGCLRRSAIAKAPSQLFETESLATLLHGIFAITMTLLILDLGVPEGSEGELLDRLGDLTPNLVTYVSASYLSPWLAVGILAADLIASLAFTVEQSTG
jgi:hypothetical protein